MHDIIGGQLSPRPTRQSRVGYGHGVHPFEHLRQVGTTVRNRARARTVVDLESRTGRGRASANVEAFSAAHIYELAPGRHWVVWVPSDGFELPLHRGAGVVARPLLYR
jgi:hypothetical protein